MSRNRVEQLNSLLQRVQQRRAEPRLVAVSGGNPLASANTNVEQREPPRALEVAPRPATNLLEALSSELTLDSTPPPAPAAPTSHIPTMPAERRPAPAAPAAPATQPPAARSEPPLQLKTPTSTVPPPVTTDALQRATTEVLPPAPLRVAPSAPLPFDAAVKVVSSPRIEQPKTFGELLEQSLALRPK